MKLPLLFLNSKTALAPVVLAFAAVLAVDCTSTAAAAPAAAELPAAATADRARGIVLPQTDGHYRITKNYVEEVPDVDYVHAGEAAYEAFRDIKFSIRIHWGVYSKWHTEASWPFLWMPAKKKQAYNELYKTFNPVKFDADAWMHFFKRCGMQAFAFTTKHHDGFSMFHTKTRVKQRANYLAPKDKIIEPCDLAYSIEETPFKRDIVKELCDAARKHALKIDLYFSHPDWYDADFRPYNSHPLTTKKYHTHFREFGHPRAIRGGIMTAEPTAAERARMVARHREQLRELLTNYGKIDMVCLDQWLGKDVWPETKETIKLLRKWAPDTLLRARGIGNYGDYFQPEGFVPGAKENTNMPWMAIIKLAKPFSYDPDPKHYKGEKWVLSHMVDCVSKGGSFMVCIGPDEFGEFHPEAVRQLEKVGDWLRTNGEGIYETRARKAWKEGAFKFTQSKDKNRIYAFTEKWPQGKFTLKTFTVKKGSAVFLLGHAKPLRWQQTPNGAEVEIPAELNAPENRPSKHIWGFKFEVQQ